MTPLLEKAIAEILLERENVNMFLPWVLHSSSLLSPVRTEPLAKIIVTVTRDIDMPKLIHGKARARNRVRNFEDGHTVKRTSC